MNTKTNNKLVSIVMPVRNAEDSIKDALSSLCVQTYREIEIIAVDDNSKDNSLRLLKSFRKEDKRIKIFQNIKHYGLQVTLNRAVKYAKGTYIAFMDPNDRSHPYRIKQQVNFLEENPRVIAVGTQSVAIDKKNKRFAQTQFPIEPEQIQNNLLSKSTMQVETIMIHRERIPKDIIKFTTPSYPHIFTTLFARLTQYGQIANIPKYLYYHRNTSTYRNIHKSSLDFITTSIKILIKTALTTGYRPSLKSVLTPSIKQA